MELRSHQRRVPLDYAAATLRPTGVRWVATAEIAGIVAALGAAGALITLAHDFLTDPRGWQTNDALVFSLCAGSAGAVVSVACFAVGRYLTHLALRRRAIVALFADGLVLLLLGIWIMKVSG